VPGEPVRKPASASRRGGSLRKREIRTGHLDRTIIESFPAARTFPASPALCEGAA